MAIEPKYKLDVKTSRTVSKLHKYLGADFGYPSSNEVKAYKRKEGDNAFPFGTKGKTDES